jgi:hypothetical protein
MSEKFCIKAGILSAGLDCKGALEASFVFFRRFLEHCHYPAWFSVKNAEDSDMSMSTWELASHLTAYSEDEGSTKLAAYAARVSSHFYFSVPAEGLSAQAFGRPCLIDALKALWKLPVKSSSLENASKETLGGVELLRKVQTQRFEKPELRKIYRDAYSVLLPDSWEQAEEVYLPARDSRLGGRWAEWL